MMFSLVGFLTAFGWDYKAQADFCSPAIRGRPESVPFSRKGRREVRPTTLDFAEAKIALTYFLCYKRPNL
jgi:hypothetical protein